MAATHTTNSTVPNAPVLYLAFDLGLRDWTLAFRVERSKERAKVHDCGIEEKNCQRGLTSANS